MHLFLFTLLQPQHAGIAAALIAHLFGIAYAQGQLRRRAGHTVEIIGNELIVHGGMVNDAQSRLRYDRRTWFIPLNETWDNITLNAFFIYAETPGLNGQALWVDEGRGTAYAYGGELSGDGYQDSKDPTPNPFQADRSPSIWALQMFQDKGARSWSKIIGKDTSKQMPQGISQLTRGAYASDKQGAYYTGGVETWGTNADIKNMTWRWNARGLLRFDFATRQAFNSLDDGGYFASRITEPNGNAYQAGYIFDSPFEPNGTLIGFGGKARSNVTVDSNGAGWKNIWIYDKATRSNHSQATNGDVPDLPDHLPHSFAAFSAIDEKHQTFEIFVYGRFDLKSRSDTIYILSLPSFTWTRTAFQNYPRRIGMTCRSARNNQAICCGGQNPEYSRNLWNTTDEWTQGIGVLDLTNVALKDKYEGNAPPYTAPASVRQNYERGQPLPVIWASPRVKQIFEDFNPNSVSTKSQFKEDNSLIKKTVPAIVVPTFLAILMLASCIRWRHRRSRALDSEQDVELAQRDTSESSVQRPEIGRPPPSVPWSWSEVSHSNAGFANAGSGSQNNNTGAGTLIGNVWIVN